MGKARPSSRARSYIPNNVSFSFTDYPIAKDYQIRPQNPQPNPQKKSRQIQYKNTFSSFTEE